MHLYLLCHTHLHIELNSKTVFLKVQRDTVFFYSTGSAEYLWKLMTFYKCPCIFTAIALFQAVRYHARILTAGRAPPFLTF